MGFDVFIAGGIVALLSLIGAFLFGNNGTRGGMHSIILPGAVGVFLAVVFFELIPETLEASHEWGPLSILVGFLAFYFLSHILETYHHHHTHDDDACNRARGKKLLIGDAIHNIADGVVIASAFIIDPTIGILTTIGIALHEIPQEIAEYGVLMHVGYTKRQALFYNFLTATSIFVGILATYFLSETLHEYIFIITGIAAGNLLYIATADLIPELRHSHRDHFAKTFLTTLISIALIGSLITYTHEEMGHVLHDVDEHDVHEELGE